MMESLNQYFFIAKANFFWFIVLVISLQCKKGNIAGVYTCIRKNVDKECEVYNNRTGLIYASYYGYLNIVNLLIDL